MSSDISIRGYRAGFAIIVLLLVAATAFALWSERRTNERTNVLVQHALERAALIGRIRVDAVSLETAVTTHVRTTDDLEREAADVEMEETLEDIRIAIAEYTDELPPGERIIWTQFKDRCETLVAQVRKARTFSNRREAQRAQRALQEKIHPLTDELDDLAAQLSQENADETRDLLRQVETIRFRSTAVGSGVAALALIVSLVVSVRVQRVVRRQEQTIEAQLIELDRRNAELDAFASRVAHDLVSPLGPLRGYVTLLKRTRLAQDASTREMLEGVDQSVGRATDLVEALLRFCRAGKQGDAQVSDLNTAVTSILMEIDQIAARDGVKLQRMLESGVRVGVPLQLLQSVAQNVISNAVKYTAGRPDPNVTVRVFSERADAVLEVVDTGIGMSDQTQAHLFQPFVRAREVRELPGHGLGLATIRKIIDAYGGTIHIRSALGKGTVVTVRFPLAPRETAVSTAA